jgi:hypothetical protein
MARRWRIVALACALLPGTVLAEEAHPHPELVRTYYDYGVAEYCGLVDAPVHNGYALLRNDQLARGKIGKEDDRQARIAAITAVDYAYQDHGLSGNKTWCRTEGAAAVERFTVYFRTRHLP